MPTYDYRCDANDRTVEVRHSMAHRVQTWGELCEIAGIDPGVTDAFEPVRKLATGGNVVRPAALKNAQSAGCNPDMCCGGGACGLNG
jgi:hypothetical protein